MALSEQQKFDVVFHLGYSGKTIIETSTDYNSTVAKALLNLSAPIESRVGKLLERVALIDEKLCAALDRLAAKRVDTIEMRDDEIDRLRREKKAVLRELSDLLDIPMVRQGSGSGISVCV